jgi:hypothetical protein
MTMSDWTVQELERIGGAQEMRVAGRRRDGSLRNPVIVWVVRRGDGLYTRSVNGPDAGWFRGTRQRHEGHISAGGAREAASRCGHQDAIHNRGTQVGQLGEAFRRIGL